MNYSIFMAGIFFLLQNSVAAAQLYIELSTETVNGGEEIHVNAQGGSPPYLWFSEAGNIVPDNETGAGAVLTTPQVAGAFKLSVRDSTNNWAETAFNVQWGQWSVTPQYVYAEPGQTVTLGFHNAPGNIKIINDAGSWAWIAEERGNGIRYTTPKKSGFYTLMLYSEITPGDTRLVHVKVYDPLRAYASEIFVENYETILLKVMDGIPPYLWIEGGKGNLDSQYGDSVRYRPGNIIGNETVTVYDATGSSIDIQVNVPPVFSISPYQQQRCVSDALTSFHVFGGKPPYSIIPPSQGGWELIDKTDDSLTLRFKKSGEFQVVAEDSAHNVVISNLTIDPEPCDSGITLEPSGPTVYLRILEDGTIPALPVLAKNPVGDVEWFCQGNCTEDNLSTTKGKIISFFPPKNGIYSLLVFDRSDRIGQLVVSVHRDLFLLYAGMDKRLDSAEMQRALDDFFSLRGVYTDSDFYHLVEQVIQQR